MDDLICDDRALQKAQNWFTDVVMKTAEFVLGGKMGTRNERL
jgi:hypothetical protein